MAHADTRRDDLTAHLNAYLKHNKQSVRDLARHARDPISGIAPSYGWIRDLTVGASDRAPDIRRLRALAAAMGEPIEHLARLAAAQWLGVQ